MKTPVVYEMMSVKPRRKGYPLPKEVSTAGPAVHETKEKGRLKRTLKKLIHIRKGH